MRKSSAIIVSAIAVGLAMVGPHKASAQGVSIYICRSRLSSLRRLPSLRWLSSLRSGGFRL